MNDYVFSFSFIGGFVLITLLALLILFIICTGAVVIEQAIERLEDFLERRNKKTKEVKNE